VAKNNPNICTICNVEYDSDQDAALASHWVDPHQLCTLFYPDNAAGENTTYNRGKNIRQLHYPTNAGYP